MRFNNIPEELKNLSQWVCWRYQHVNGRWTKIPKQPSNPHANADVSSPRTWGTFEMAAAAVRRQLADGVGLVLTADLGIVAWDLDHCIDNIINAQARQIVRRLATYTEITPSGRGLRILCRGTLPPRSLHRRSFGEWSVEVYDSDRYVSITGCHLGGTPKEIATRTAEIADLYKELFGEKELPSNLLPSPSTRVTHTHNLTEARVEHTLARIISTMPKRGLFPRLWYSTDAAGYPSPSEADLALANILLKACNGDAPLAEAVFSRSPRGQRQKWRSRPDYRRATFAAAARPRLKNPSSR